MIRGRCIEAQANSLVILNAAGVHRVAVTGSPLPQVGDIVEHEGGTTRVLTPHRRAQANWPWTERVLHPRRVHATQIRARVESLIRQFFLERGFLETPTPLLVPCPGMETHIRTFEARGTSGSNPGLHLPTSPEFAMKRLLVGGLERIFQLAPAFRDEPRSRTHLPQFLMLEWYRAYEGYEAIQQDTEHLLEYVALQLFGRPELTFQGRTISVRTPWPRLRVRDLFAEHAGIELTETPTAEAFSQHCRRLGLACDPTKETWDDLYFKVWLNVIEPQLPRDQAVFVLRYPPSQAALSVIDTDSDGSRWARRFEAYVGDLELANAFEELTDPQEQRSRFIRDMRTREETYGARAFPPTAIDEGFIDALTEGMPPAGGIALGVDRLVMLMADEPDIDFTVWLRP